MIRVLLGIIAILNQKGGCGKTKFACVDGPDFDGFEVDFDETIRRSHTYYDEERRMAREEKCKLMEGAKNA